MNLIRLQALFWLLLLLSSRLVPSGLAAPGDVDPEFNPDANGIVYCTALQTGGKIVVGGEFTTMNGVVRNRIARLNKDGTLDTDFDPGADNVVFSIAMQSDGKAIVAGGFTNLGGMAGGRIARLNPNGMPDSSFNPLGNASVRTVTVQSDGKIVIGGAFTSLGGVPRNRIARLNRDGTVEPRFNPDADGVVYSTAVDPVGNIIIRGDFSRVGGVARNRIARLNADGTLDPSFDPNISGVTFLGFSSLALQVDGKVLVGGDFTTVGGTARSYLARVNTDGTLDTGFNPNPDFDVLSIAVQTDGAIVIGGGFSMVGGMAHDSIAQLNLNGTLSPGFTPTLNGSIRSIALQADGKVIIGGGFTSVSGAVRNRIARLQNYRATQSLEVVGRDVVRWMRAGASPEAQEVIFDLSVDKGATWTLLGAGTRIPSGWELVGLSLPSNGLIRASARVIGGFYDGTSGLIDEITSFPSSDNTAPTVTNPIADLIVNEDAVKTSIDLTTVFNDAETTASGLVFTVMTNTNPALMTATFATTTNLTLTYATNASGTDAITVRATDIGGLQVEDTFVVTVNAVNDAPAVMFATNVVVLEKAAPHSLPGFAAFLPGPTDESNQRLVSYAVSNNNNEMFIIQPSIDDAGTLSFTPAPSAHSSAYITVIAQDDGGTAKGGEDKTTNSFIISAIVDMVFNPNANERVYTTTLQPDGKTIIAGEYFTTISGTARNRLARLNADGTIDLGFNPDVGGFGLYATTVQGDGRIIIGGTFNGVGGAARRYLARLNADGTLDSAFNPNADDAPNSIAVQADGKFIVAGGFTSVGGATRNRLARFNADGSLDASFNPNVDYSVYGVALQPDGKIVITGLFNFVNGTARNSIARLNADGTLDTSFNPNVLSWARVAAVQPDGKIIVGGDFTFVSNRPRPHCARLNADGTLDSDFNPTVNDVVWSLVLQTDGKIVIAGWFTTVGGAPHNCIARLNADGTVDSVFDPQAGGIIPDVYNVTVQPDGRIVIAGRFTSVDGLARNHVARLLNDPATQSLSVLSVSRVEWLRGGASPEAQGVGFDVSTDGGASWRSLGAGARIAGGWAASGVSLPPSGLVRARARVTSGRCAGSSGLIEAVTAYSLASVASPRLVGPTLLSNGAFQFGFTNLSSTPFTALATSNLALPSSNWTVLGPATEIFPGQFQFTDLAATNFPYRFYQIRSP